MSTPLQLTRRPELAVEFNELGQPTKVVLDDIDITSLVSRLQSVTDLHGTKHEVVLSYELAPAAQLQ